jgi:hypothetical protein
MTLATLALAGTRVHHNIPPSMFFLLSFGMLALFILMIYATNRERRKRSEGLARFAMESGFTYSATSDSNLQSGLEAIQVPGQFGSSPRFSNILQGVRSGCDVLIADRTVSNGKSTTRTTVLAFKLAQALPRFVMYPENAVWRLADKVGYTDIDFDGAPEFSRRFFLHGEDPAAVRALFTPDVTHAFEQLSPQHHLFVGSSGSWLAFSRPGRTLPIEELPDVLQKAEMIASSFRHSQTLVSFGADTEY